MNADGDIDWEVTRAKIPPGVSQERVDQIYNACKDISKYNMNLTRAKLGFYSFTKFIL